ncbi:hypothetical protein [Acinetobacter guillouiae]|uniref:hypothetical protein n=1 Tax=Acinetobacter guillouiae TaxID=106649 RepID=UPI001AE5BCC4|nr:hypothetical protein [Acinetobacter guillouiae]MBP2544980.1 hypothetical protein [Acinetobacter guillouiae]
MGKKLFFVWLLVFQFTFQNVWYVVESLCLNEISTQTYIKQNIDDKESLIAMSDVERNIEKIRYNNEINQFCQNICLSDKCNFISNFADLKIERYFENTFNPFFNLLTFQRYRWLNLYQSPELNNLSPPPKFKQLYGG